MRKTNVRRFGALLVGLALFAAACGDDDDSASDATDAPAPEATEAGTEAPAETEAPEGTEAPATTAGGGGEAECGEATSDTTGGALAGFAGTTPLTPISDDFLARLCEVDPELIDLNYAGETYDVVTLIALAVEQAQDDGIAYASEINGLTRDGDVCTDFVSCKEIIAAGGDVDYDGVSGPLNFAGNGEPLQASYGLQVIGDNNRIDNDLTEFVEVEGSAELDVPQVPVEGNREGDGVLTIGTILPQTGNLAYLGPPEFAGFNLAINEINEAGGVLGQPIVGIEGDSGDTSTDTANQTVDRQLAQNVDAIVGAASSGVTLTVIDKIAGAGVVQFSPANTSPELSNYPDKGLYFRTAPPDIYQGAVIGQIVAEDGHATVAFISRNDSYGTGLTEEATAALEEAGVEVVETQIYDENATTFDAEVQAVAAADPDAVILISFNEGSRILTSMVESGIGPLDIAVYGCDGNIGNALGVDFDAGD